MRRTARSLVLVSALVVLAVWLTVAPVAAWFNALQIPAHVHENQVQTYKYKYTEDQAGGGYVLIVGEWYDAWGTYVGGFTADWGYFQQGETTGWQSMAWTYDCQSMSPGGGLGLWKVTLVNAGYTSQTFPISDDC